jgi:hypothetical protein
VQTGMLGHYHDAPGFAFIPIVPPALAPGYDIGRPDDRQRCCATFSQSFYFGVSIRVRRFRSSLCSSGLSLALAALSPSFRV